MDCAVSVTTFRPLISGDSTRSQTRAEGKDANASVGDWQSLRRTERGQSLGVAYFGGRSHRAGEVSGALPLPCGRKAAHPAQPGHLRHRGRKPAAPWQRPPHNARSCIIYCARSTSHPTALEQAGGGSLSRWHLRDPPRLAGRAEHPSAAALRGSPDHDAQRAQVECHAQGHCVRKAVAEVYSTHRAEIEQKLVSHVHSQSSTFSLRYPCR